MARQTQPAKTIQEYLNDNDCQGIIDNYPNLTFEDCVSIINNIYDYDNINVDALYNLIKNMVMPILQNNSIQQGKQRVAQLKSNKVVSAKAGNKITSRETLIIGQAYRILASCCNYNGDIYASIEYYTKAHERCGIDCSQELRALTEGNPTPVVDKIVAKAKSLKGGAEQSLAQSVANYAYVIIDNVLQLSTVSLSEDIRDNLRTMLSTYLRNEVDGIRENPLIFNLVSAFEKILKELIFIPYAKYLDENETDINVSQTCRRLRNKKVAHANSTFTNTSSSFTMGKITPLIIESFNNGRYVLDQTFYDFIASYYNIDTTKFNEAYFIKLAQFIDLFRDSVRNPVAHGIGMYQEAFMRICEDLLLKEDSWIRQLIEMADLCYTYKSNFEDLISIGGFGGDSGISKGVGQENGSFGGLTGSNANKSIRFNIDSFSKELQSFVSVFGRYPSINSKNKSEKLLAKRVGLIRIAKRGQGFKLSEKDMTTLNEIGFVWGEKIDWFNEFYNSLLQYKSEYGTLYIPHYYVDDYGNHLGQNVRIARNAYKGEGKINLTEEQIGRLENIGFVWDVKKEETKWFDDFYQELIEYKAVYGNFKGVIYDKILAPEVMSFVGSYQKQKLGKPSYRHITREMIIKLKEIGFELNVRQKNQNINEDDNDLQR